MHNFQSRFVMLSAGVTSLPFTVGGATQHGHHMPEGNNQDAMSLWIDEASIIAIVCDGCASSSPHGANAVSFNETGAQLLSVLAIQTIKSLLSRGVLPGEEMVALVEQELHKKYSQLVSLLGRDESFWREHILFELLMSTIVGAVISHDRWCVFHGGDGLVIFNGQVQNLDGQSGQYLANSMVLREQQKSPGKMLRILHDGESSSLHSLLIGSDGVLDLVASPGLLLEGLSGRLEQRSSPYDTGYDTYFFKEFRKRVWNPMANGASLQDEQDEHDDRTLLLIRRLPEPISQRPSVKVTSLAPLSLQQHQPFSPHLSPMVKEIQPLQAANVCGVAPDSLSTTTASGDQPDSFQRKGLEPELMEKSDRELSLAPPVSCDNLNSSQLPSICSQPDYREDLPQTFDESDVAMARQNENSTFLAANGSSLQEEVPSVHTSTATPDDTFSDQNISDKSSGDKI